MGKHDRQFESDILNEIATLRQLLSEREKEIQLQSRTIETLESEVALKSANIETLESRVELQSRTIQVQTRRHQELEDHVRLLLKRLYGRRRERFIGPDQLLLFDENDLKALAQEARDEERE